MNTEPSLHTELRQSLLDQLSEIMTERTAKQELVGLAVQVSDTGHPVYLVAITSQTSVKVVSPWLPVFVNGHPVHYLTNSTYPKLWTN